MSGPHVHSFTQLYTHFGPHGEQNVHYHVCFNGRCSAILIGDGRTCDGQRSTHREEEPSGKAAA